MKNEIKNITEWYHKDRPATMKQIIVNSLKFAQVIYERTGSCVRVISRDGGELRACLKKRRKNKAKGGVNSRKGKDNKPPNKSQNSQLCPVELLFKLFKFHVSFPSRLEWTTALFFLLLASHILIFQHQQHQMCYIQRDNSPSHLLSPSAGESAINKIPCNLFIRNQQ